MIFQFNRGSRIGIAEITVVMQLNQGTSRKTGCYRFPGAFLFLFGQTKRKRSLIMISPATWEQEAGDKSEP
jgi:hypothetical protein